ncbi:MAG: hypothetical protein ACP5FK_04020 [bacterium]
MKYIWFILIIIVPLSLLANDEDLFRVKAGPAALILLDRSGSMGSLDGDTLMRIQEAILVIKDLLDADRDGVVEDEDKELLNVDVGQMFYVHMPKNQCFADQHIYVPGQWFNHLAADSFGVSYCTLWTHLDFSKYTPGMMNNSVGGYTPNGPALYYASRWVDEFDSTHPDLDCRKYYVILISDGESNKTGNDSTYVQLSTINSYQGSWSLVREAAASYHDRGIPVFSVGFGPDLTEHGRNELNWAAYWGGTDNPDVYNYSDMDYNPPHKHVHDPWTWPVPIPSNWGATNGWYSPRSAVNNSYEAYPPSYHRCEGYAFIAKDARELAEALRKIFNAILADDFSFSPASVPVVRTTLTDSSIIIATFRPNEYGFWDGQVTAHSFHGDTVIGDEIWSAGDSLLITPAIDRNIYFNYSGSKQEFNSTNVQPWYLGNLITVPQRNLIVEKVREGYSPGNPGWKMGDVFHSAPLLIGSPSAFYEGDDSYILFRKAHLYREAKKIVLVGTNTGTLHCFDGFTGHEKWAWVPDFALEELAVWTMDEIHTYILDGPVTAADVWTDLNGDGIKAANEWKTIMVIGQREGGNNYLALDITEFPDDPDTSPYPQFVASLSGAPINGGATVRYFGNTWSQPTAGQFLVDPDGVGVDTTQALWGFVMGGGWVPNATETGSIPDTGNFLTFLGFYQNHDTTFGLNSTESYGIASAVSLADWNINKYVDEIIVQDVGGNLLIIDNLEDTSDMSAWNFRSVFNPDSGAPADADMMGFFSVSAAKDGSGQKWYCYGTGNRSNPMDSSGYGYFFIFRDPPAIAGAPAALTDMQPLSSLGNPPGDNGWYYRHQHQGEKVTSIPLIYQGYVYWTTFTPDMDSAGPCDVGQGYARLYIATINTGTLVNMIDFGHLGIPSSPQITVGPDGPVVVVMTSSGPVLVEIMGPGLKKKYVYWNEVF